MSNTNFPTTLDSATDPTSGQFLNSPSHSAQHGFENDAIVALETKVGIDSSAVTTTHDYKLQKVVIDHDANGKHKIDIVHPEWYAIDAVGTDAYAVTLSPAPASYTAGMMVNFIPNVANTGACSINVNSLGIKNIKYLGQDPADNMILSGLVTALLYDGTNFNILNPATRTIGYAQSTSAFSTSSATAVQVTNLSVTVNAPGISRLRITAFASNILNNTSTDAYEMTIWDGTVGSGTQLSRCLGTMAANGQSLPSIASAIVAPAAGSKTYNVGLQADTGGTVTISAGITFPSYISVELI